MVHSGVKGVNLGLNFRNHFGPTFRTTLGQYSEAIGTEQRQCRKNERGFTKVSLRNTNIRI